MCKLQDMVSQAVETSSEKSCVALCELLGTLRTTTVTGLPAPLLSADDVKEAVYRFLANFDDVLIDAPKAVSCTTLTALHSSRAVNMLSFLFLCYFSAFAGHAGRGDRGEPVRQGAAGAGPVRHPARGQRFRLLVQVSQTPCRS